MMSLTKRLQRPCGRLIDPGDKCGQGKRCKECHTKLTALRYISRLEKAIEIAGVQEQVAVAYVVLPNEIMPNHEMRFGYES